MENPRHRRGAGSLKTRFRAQRQDCARMRLGRRTKCAGYACGDVQTYDEALLIVDPLRPNERDLLWGGNATYRLAAHSSPEKTTKLVNEAVEKIFAQFPPAPETG